MNSTEKTQNHPFSLAIDTSGRQGSAAICGPENQTFTHTFSGPMRHSAELFPAIESLLRKANASTQEIGLVCIAAGPGSFTGLRIAVSLAKMMALCSGTRIAAVNTLDASSLNADAACEKTKAKIQRTGVILDAKRGQFFAGIYRKQPHGWVSEATNLLITAEDLLRQFAGPDQNRLFLLGEGLLYYKDRFADENVEIVDAEFWSCRAENVLKLGLQMAGEGKLADPATLVPFYVQKPDAKEKAK